jgi:cytoskeletal protein CcmA (bactofilin family)
MADKDFVVKNGLVVNTNSLVVDGTNNKVGVNTASPDATLSVVGTANISGNVTMSSNLNVTGNTILTGRFEVVNNAYVDRKLYVGNTATMIQDLPTIIQAVDNFNGFVMISSQNLSLLDDACADLITYADNTNGLSHFNDIGINNSRFDGTIHRIIANSVANTWLLGETVYQRNGAGANIAVGVIRDIVSINSTAASLKISVNENDGLETYVGISDFVPTVGANLSLRAVTSGANSDVLFALPFFSPLANTLNRRNYGFTIGRRGDGYLYNANSALTIGTTGGGMRVTEQSLSVSTFESGQTTIHLSSGNTSRLYSEMIITGTGIPGDAYIRSISNSTAFVMSKATTAGSTGTYIARDPYYEPTGNPIIFHVNGMMAKHEIARFNGNGNFVIGANTTARNSKLTVAGTANITGNTVFGNNITVAGNTTIAGNINTASIFIGANASLTSSTLQIGNTVANIVANSTLIKLANSSSTANLSPIDLKIGATVVNSTQVSATLFSGNISGGYATVSGAVNSATIYATGSANIASAVQANATGVWTTGQVNAASHTVGAAFTANSTVVNAVSYYSGALFVANSTVSNATHLVGATWAAPSVLGSSTANGASLTYANVTGQVNTATLYASGSANIASVVHANSSGIFTTATAKALNITSGAGFGAASAGLTANASAVSISSSATVNTIVSASLIKISNSTSTANLSAVDLKIGTSTVNSLSISAGANLIANTTALFIGNTIANSTHSSSLIQIANSTATANLTPVQLKIGTTTVNTTAVQVGSVMTMNSSVIKIGDSANSFSANSTTLLLGNTTVNAIVNSTAVVFANSTSTIVLSPQSFDGTAQDSIRLGNQLPSYYTTYSDTKAATAYTNAAAYADTKAGAAYTNAITYSGNAVLAYTNAIAYSANASRLTSGTVDSGRLTGAYGGITNVGTLSILRVGGNTTLNNFSMSSNPSTSANLVAFGAANVTFDTNVLAVDSVNNRVGINTTTPDAAFQVSGNANVSGNLAVGVNMTIGGSLSVTGAFNPTGNINPTSNNLYVGNTTNLWNFTGNNITINKVIGANVTSSATIYVGANVVANTISLKVGDGSYYSLMTNTKFETTGNVIASGVMITGSTSAGANNVTVSNVNIKIANATVNATINSTAIVFANVTASATINATNFPGTSNNSSYLNGQAASYYTNYSDTKAGAAYTNAVSYVGTTLGGYALKTGATFTGPVIVSNTVSIANTLTVSNHLTINSPGVLTARFRPRVLTYTGNGAAPACNTDLYDVMVITGQSTNITSMGSAFTGTPYDGQQFHLAITSSSGSRSITWNTLFEASGGLFNSLPSTFTTTRKDMTFIWNTASANWRMINLA